MNFKDRIKTMLASWRGIVTVDDSKSQSSDCRFHQNSAAQAKVERLALVELLSKRASFLSKAPTAPPSPKKS